MEQQNAPGPAAIILREFPTLRPATESAEML